MDVYNYIDGEIPNDEYCIWVDVKDLKQLPIIGAHLKIIKKDCLSI